MSFLFIFIAVRFVFMPFRFKFKERRNRNIVTAKRIIVTEKKKNRMPNSRFKKWRKMCKIHIFLSQEFLSYPKVRSYEVRHFMKRRNVGGHSTDERTNQRGN